MKKITLRILSLSLMVFCICKICAGETKGIYDLFDYGAKGDGETPDTKAIQSAIDKCHEDGGGMVYLHNGCFISGTIQLKSNVTFYVEVGGILRASNNMDDFPIVPSKYPSYTGELVTNKMLIYAEDAKNISIMGRGTINGNGDHWLEGPYGSPSFSVRPRIIHFRACENIRICDVTLYNSASWVESYQSCRNLVIDGITVNSRPNKDIEKPWEVDAPHRNCDGLDLIDCQKVCISNCNINSGDDGICLKSFSPNEACQDITITNCVVSSNASGIKIGTETSGAFFDITVNNCVVYNTRFDALAIMTTDGAQIERINISNITIRNIKGTAIYVGLGRRNRQYRKGVETNKPWLKDITFDNIMATEVASNYRCSLNGMATQKIENIKLRNIDIQFCGGKTWKYPPDIVPEKEDMYPSGGMCGKLPAYGFFVRHAKNITFENVTTRFKNKDQRPALWCDDVEQLDIKGLKAMGTLQTPELIRLINTRDVMISESKPTSEIPTFLTVNGDKSANITLLNNSLRNSGQTVLFEKKSIKKTLTEIGTLK